LLNDSHNWIFAVNQSEFRFYPSIIDQKPIHWFKVNPNLVTSNPLTKDLGESDMRFLLAIMAMALFAVSVGCESPTSTTDSAAPSVEAEAANGETQMVSLKLPGMT